VKLRIGRSVVGHPIKESEMAYIVLVEDDKDVAEVVCDALRAEGHPLVIRSKAGAEHFVRPDLVVGLTAGWRRRPAAGETIGLGNNVPVIVTSDDIVGRSRPWKPGSFAFRNRSGGRTWQRRFQNCWPKRPGRRN
jgi:hypothetical protein